MAKISKKRLKKGNRSKLEKKLDEVNHTMELIRTVIPIIILVVQIIILIKLFG
jgi:heme/copper-type cytochrome/quinol oxidase subunit 2